MRLGVALPGETIAGDPHNPEGYFEWDAVVSVQERLLIDLERWWPAPEGTLALPEGWLEHPATREARACLRDLLLAEAHRQTGLWAIKDPRCSRLLPLWIALARELEIPLELVLAVRDPAEVVASLVQRDGPLTGMDANRAQQLWWRHNLEVVQAARAAALPLALVDFAAWFEQPQAQMQRLLAALPSLKPSALQREAALALIKPHHRRSHRAANPAGLDPTISRLHGRLLHQPLPRRLPRAEPPQRLRRRQAPPRAASSLEADPASWPAWLERHRHYPAPRCWQTLELAADPRLHVCGPSWQERDPHLLLQRAPLSELSLRRLDPGRCLLHRLSLEPDPGASGSLDTLALNLELPPPERAQHWLDHLRHQQVIFDPEPARVLLLRDLGLPAWWLDRQGPVNGWLKQPLAASAAVWSRELGQAPPAPGALIVLGPAGSMFDRALAAEATAGLVPEPPIQYWPGWPELIITTPAAGLARAGWWAAASERAAALLLADALPPQATPAELRAIHRGAPLRALAEDRPSPPMEELFRWEGPDAAATAPGAALPKAAVLVSLHNYADRIEAALESVAAQTAAGLELIVVDDASGDDGAVRVQAWMASRTEAAASGSPTFARLLLLRHSRNAGLAAARNSAFAAARAPWCFVLDADNALFPAAVAACLALADSGAEDLAVVHPLLAVEAEPGRPDDQRSLVSTASWQQPRLLSGNVVDAMALVRRSAWQAVGGYSHIEGGWEDYDFWCKLVGAGWHGIQCPQILAVYRSHAASMSHTATNRSWRALSRTLQDRHPWLELPLATP